MEIEADAIRPGLRAERRARVDESMVTTHVGGAGVLGTPFMILLMEWAAADAVEPALPPGSTTVGFEVCIRHLAPSPLGAEVVAEAVLAEADGRKLLFDVVCRDGERVVGRGTHRRTVIRVAP